MSTPRAGGVRFFLLGPLEVRHHGEPIAIGSGRERALLTALLLRANRLMSVDELVDQVWGEQPPVNPRATIQTFVMRLRRRLPGGPEIIRTQPGGYLAAPPYLDLDVFRAHLAAAARAAEQRDLAGEAGELRAGLALWRGSVLANVPSETLQRDVVPGLAEERLTALCRRIEVDLELGHAAAVVSELRALTAEYPLRERFWALLIRSLHLGGRRAEALDAFEMARRRLADELGVDPGEELRRLHRTVLAGDAHRPPAQAKPVVPRQLPPDVRAFTGRIGDLEKLDAQLAEQASSATGAVVISAIAGTAGVGKTALAVHWARRVANRFPDGQLWMNLRGYHPDQPLTPGQALATLLRTLGVPGAEIPLDLDAQTGLYRSLLADRRVLVVLDNVNSAEQVRPLLPGARGCLALITSRDDLSGLVARDGAVRIRLGLLAQQDSITLLRRLLDIDQASTEHDALARVAALCARLPLALRIAAERLSAAGRPLGQSVADLENGPLLDALAAANDPHTAARAVFSWSYRALPADAAALFRRLGLVPGADWDSYVAAAVAGNALPEARRLLGLLASGHLIEERGGRFHMHDLLRAYAIEQAEHERHEQENRAATARLFDYYLATAAAAMDTVFPHERHRRPRLEISDIQMPPMAVHDHAMAWLDVERPNLCDTVARAVTEGWPAHSIALAGTLHRYLLTGAHWAEGFRVHHHALQAARAVGDRQGEATALNNLGMFHSRSGKSNKASDYYQQALSLFRGIGDRAGEATTLNNLGYVCMIWGHYERAFDYLQHALVIRRNIQDRAGEADALNNLGWYYLRRAQYNQASDHYQQTIVIRREIGDRPGEADSLNNLGMVCVRMHRYEESERHHQVALSIAREIGYGIGEGQALSNLGTLYLRWQRLSVALDHCRQAIAVAREIGHRSIEVSSLNGLGEASQAIGRPREAVASHREALELAKEIGEPLEQARALDGLGNAMIDLGDQDDARQRFQEALELYADLGLPEADRVAERLDELGHRPTR